VYKKRSYSSRRKPDVIANQYIRYPEVRVLDEEGKAIGIMSSREAQSRAIQQDMDLVLVTDQAKPPVVKIIELSKFKYQQQQKKAKNRKSARTQEIKEVRLSMFMGDQDFQARLKRITRFLKKGDKVRLNMLFRGREITKKEFGYELFSKVIEATNDLAEVEMEPKIMGRKLIAQLIPLK